jgi:hypothetical protein
MHDNVSDIKKLQALVEMLREQLSDVASSTRCGCLHKSCNRCERDKENEKLLSMTSSDAYILMEAETIKSLQFPVMLRKMWSGGEVQHWLEERADLKLSLLKSQKEAV